MGKRVIIKGADFSANAIPVAVYLDLSPLNAKFFAQESLSESSKNTNTKRSCVYMYDVSALTGTYSYMKIKWKTGYDCVLGLRNGNNLKWYDADGNEGSFAWITSVQEVAIPVSATYIYLSINIRHDDNTTIMAADGKVEDYIDSIELLK